MPAIQAMLVRTCGWPRGSRPGNALWPSWGIGVTTLRRPGGQERALTHASPFPILHPVLCGDESWGGRQARAGALSLWL